MQQDKDIDSAARAASFVAEDLITAFRIITASLANRCGVAAEVKADLEKTLEFLESQDTPPGKSVVTHALRRVAESLGIPNGEGAPPAKH